MAQRVAARTGVFVAARSLADAESPGKKRSFRLARWQDHAQDCQI